MYYSKKKVELTDIKKAPGLNGGLSLPSNNVNCDLVECCNYYNPGPPDGVPEYDNCVDQFHGIGIYGGIAQCGSESTKYAACTIGGQVRYMASPSDVSCDVLCCNKAYVGYGCNVDLGYINIVDAMSECCNTRGANGWACSTSTSQSEINKC